MIDPPTPAGYVADAEEALRKARAMSDHHASEFFAWNRREILCQEYYFAIRAWAAAGGTGRRPKKPKEPT